MRSVCTVSDVDTGQCGAFQPPGEDSRAALIWQRRGAVDTPTDLTRNPPHCGPRAGQTRETATGDPFITVTLL